MKMVLVKWVDAVTQSHGWRSMDDLKKSKPSNCQSIGWILRQTKTHITLIACVGDQDCDGDITIPTGMIKEIIPLVAKKK